jgi:glucose/mannose-6-phosphate isomerase
VKESQKSIEKSNFTDISEKFNKIVQLGMGGSAMAGDLLSYYLKDEINIPFFTNRNYFLPNFVDHKTLIIATSYSGQTEETLSALNEAFNRNAQVIIQTSGGALEKLAKEKKVPILNIPPGYPPRQALGYMFFTALLMFQKIGIIGSKNKEIKETIKILEKQRDQNDPQKTRGHNLSNHIAQKLYQKIPIVYTASELFHPLVTRWKHQFNENAKILSFSNVFPELNHNEIIGWEGDKNLLKCFCVLFLRDTDEFKRNQKRLEITRDIFRKNKIPIFELFPEGKNSLARMFSLIYLADWISYYLALLYKKDPIKIDSIDFIKNELSQYSQ